MSLDLDLVRRVKRPPAKQSMTWKQCVAANLLRRDGVKMSVLVDLFGVSRNTLYYKALTGDSKGYAHSATATALSGPKVNAFIAKVGIEKARQASDYHALAKRVNAINDRLVRAWRR